MWLSVVLVVVVAVVVEVVDFGLGSTPDPAALPDPLAGFNVAYF